MNNKIKVTSLALALTLTFAACSNDDNTDNAESTADVQTTETEVESVESTEDNFSSPASTEVEGSSETVEMSDTLLHRGYAAPHGEDSVARVVVLTSGETIVDASLDELQYFDEDSDFEALPSSDGAFGEGAAEGKILGSKTVNSDQYSELMADIADSTVTIADNYQAITNFVKGKTIDEVEEALTETNEDGTIDAVTGATLADTAGYLQAIVDVARDDSMVSNVEADDLDSVTLHQAYGAPHGDKSFADVIVAVEDGVVVGASIDELQYFGENGLPNSDKEFGEDYADDENQLSSKVESSDEYSALMEENADSTVTIADNFTAIENFVVGKTADEIQSVIDESEDGEPIDAVTGATLADTAGYLQLIVDAINE